MRFLKATNHKTNQVSYSCAAFRETWFVIGEIWFVISIQFVTRASVGEFFLLVLFAIFYSN